MRKILLVLTIFSAIAGSYFILDNSQKDSYSSDDLAQIELQKKKEKRKNGYHKMDKPDEYVKYHMAIRTRDGMNSPEYPSNYKFSELKKARVALSKSKTSAKATNLDWTQRGPANVPGRTRGLVVFEDDITLNTWLAGSVGGGIWKTTDGGDTWVSKTDDLPNLSISYFGISKSNQSIVYAGTGEGFFNVDAISGDGIFKSLDQGETWTQLSSTATNSNFGTINRIAVDNTDSDILVVATQNSLGNNYIMKSIDGGTSWTQEHFSPRRIQDLKADPDNFNILYASINGVGIIKSTDAGDNWINSSIGLRPSGRIEIAVSPANTSRIFLSTQGDVSGNDSDLYITDDAGANWSIVLEENDGDEIDFLGGQGWYDNTIAADPYNKDVVYYGGVNLWKNTIASSSESSNVTSITVDQDNTTSFLTFTDFSAPYFGGALDIGSIDPTEFVTVEIRFGQGTQMAHRFTIPSGQGSGVPADDYTYNDYVEVPFQAWDINNNKQLMISFRDQQDDGVFNLIESNTDGDATGHSREYLFIHSEEYNATNSSNISVAGGQEVNQMYFIWSVLSSGGTWDKDNLPNSALRINYAAEVILRFGSTENITDAYGRHASTNTDVHPDHHNLLMVKVDEVAQTYKILNGNDGGIYISNTSTQPGVNDGDWTSKSNGYITGQFYGADKKKGANEYIGGLQDNGTWVSPIDETASNTTNYQHKIGGDGFEVIWNSNDTDKAIGGSQRNNFRRTIDGGRTWTNATSGLSGTHPFISKLENSNANPDVIFTVSTDGVFRSTDFGGSWRLTSITDNWGSGNFLNVEVSLANFDVVWAGSALSSSSKLHFSTDNGLTFSEANLFANLSGPISGIETHPVNDSTAYALFSFANEPKILRTTDMGTSWEDISGFGTNTSSSTGFPDVAVYSLLVMPHDTNVIWAGTEIGLFESLDNGATWNYADNGLPAVSVWQMKVVDDQVVIATHGRGIWTVTIPELLLSQFSINQTRYIGDQKMEVDVYLVSNFDKIEIFVDDELELSLTENLTQGSHTYQIPKTKEATSRIYIIAYLGGSTYRSSTVNSVEANFDPILTRLTASEPNELLFDVQSAEPYTSIKLYLDNEKVGEITDPVIGQNEMIVSGLDNKTVVGRVDGILNGVAYSSEPQTVKVITGTFFFWESKAFSIFPNPSSDHINIKLEDGDRISDIHIYNLKGKLVSNTKSSRVTSIDISKFEEGIYFVKFRLDDKNYSEKIIIGH